MIHRQMIKFSTCTLTALLTILQMQGQETYQLGQQSQRFEGIPRGVVTQHTWESQIYQNTTREYYVYAPAQYSPDQPAALMVFQDGHAYVNEDGKFRVPVVFDNLIAQGKMPVTIGLFVNPGHRMDIPTPESPWRAVNRTFEYDEVSDKYARFLVNEMIPELQQTYNISSDPAMRAICGLSSGGICAFSAAWFRPDQFHKVMSHIGSFADIRGGHNYPPMIRKSGKKDIKVFLQDGENDLDLEFGNWWLCNLQMASALEFKGYDYKFVGGKGGHEFDHGGAILPESLAWLWSDVVPGYLESGVHTFPSTEDDPVLWQGATTHFEDVEFRVGQLTQSAAADILDAEYEQIFIVKEGTITFTFSGAAHRLGPNSVAVVPAGHTVSMQSRGDHATFYTMRYMSRNQAINPEKQEPWVVDFNDLEFQPHDRGGVRSYFRTSTPMCSYYEMHVTTLKPHVESHPAHTHGAEEIILMIKGDTEMHIGNGTYQARSGDVYYVGSEVPHGIRNTGDTECMYFAFQWDAGT